MTPETAINHLAASDRGQRALLSLSLFLDDGGAALDAENQRAVATLLAEAWIGPRGATVREMIRESAGEAPSSNWKQYPERMLRKTRGKS